MMRLGFFCFIRSVFFFKLLNLKELFFFVVCKKKIFLLSLKIVRVKGEGEINFFLR